VAGEVSDWDSVESIDRTHPEDRNRLVEAFIDAVMNPGTPVFCSVRAMRDGVWQHNEMTWVNLVDHPDVGAVICAVIDVDGPPIEPPVERLVGDTAATNWMIASLDHHGRVTSVRGRLDAVLGYADDEVIGHILIDFIHPECLTEAIENWVGLWQNPDQTRTARWVWRHRDGRDVWLESSYLVLHDDLVEAVVVDVDERVANELALAASQREVAALAEDFRLLAEEIPTAVFRCDAAGVVQFHNAHWVEMFPELGPVNHLHDVVAPDARADLDAALDALRSGEGDGSTSLEVLAFDGSRIIEIRCRAVMSGDDEPRFVGTIADVTSAAHFRHRALHDPLTDLPNRAMVEGILREAVATDPDGTLVVFIDLDGFKDVNDEHGHAAGDAVLNAVADRLAAAVRPGDTVGRFGGDEFVVVCRGAPREVEGQIVERLRAVFAEPIEVDGTCWQPGASLGVARPEPGVDSDTVLRRADQAMFEQKRTRRA
jgi:diguanylate cyclase (GGDEF)-like protein/PAS domain S-box-containing protein